MGRHGRHRSGGGRPRIVDDDAWIHEIVDDDAWIHEIVDDDAWIHEIDPHWAAVWHPGPFPDLPVRQELFEGALDFDVVPMWAGRLSEMLDIPHIARLVGEAFSPMGHR